MILSHAKQVLGKAIRAAGLLPVILGLGLVPRAAADFFVATNGSDANPGTLAAPFLTLTQAQTSVRAALPSATGPLTVWLRGGTYYPGQTIRFAPQDSGSATVPVTYSAYSNEVVTWSGAIRLNPSWSVSSGNIMVATIATNLDFDGLFVNGAPQVLARYPNYSPGTAILNGYNAACISSNRAARWSNPATGLVRGLQGSQWGGNSFKITGLNASTGVPVMSWVGDNNRGSSLSSTYVMVENLFEELDTTNEWFYNKTTGSLYYWPPAGLNLATATIEAAAVTELAGFRGTATNNPVKYITLSNLIFTETHRSLFNTPYEGLMRGDWAVAREGTIYMSNADYITIQNSIFTNVGGNGVFMSAHNRTNLVNNNLFVNVGATCVQVVGLMSATRNPSTWSSQQTSIGDFTAGPLTDDYPMGVVVSSNHMYNLGVFEKESAGVNISEADTITVSHNTIHTSPRSGINVNCGCFGGHLIEFNDVWDCVRETSDHGPFNSWGRDRFWSYPDTANEGNGTEGTQKQPYALLDCRKPTVIRNNRFEYATVQTWGIDLDDGSSNYQIYNNVCLNTGFKLRDGFSRHVFNNIIVNQCGNLQVWYAGCRDAVDHNLIVNSSPWATVSLTTNSMTAMQVNIDTNFFWNGGSAVSLPLTGWTNAGYDVHSLAVNPQFSNPANNDYTVNNAQILAAGFTNIPMNQFGTTWPGIPTPPPVSNVASGTWVSDPEPLMGGTVTSIYSPTLEGSLGLPDTNGVCFQAVPAGSYAAGQGLMANDVIRQINGVTVTTKPSFWTNYTVIAPGTPVSLAVFRNAFLVPLMFLKPGGPEALDETAGTVFSGTGWQVQSNAGCFNSDIHYTTVNGDSFQFSFNGTGIEFMAETYSDEGNVDVYLDGTYDRTVSCATSSRLYQQVVYTNQNLAPGVHTIEGIKDNSSYMILDAFTILQPAAPAAPSNLAAAVSTNQIQLTWTDQATNETGYVVERSAHAAGTWTMLTNSLPAGAANFTDTGLSLGTSYDYQVCAVGTGGPSAFTAITATTLLAAGTGLTWRGDGLANSWNLQSTNWSAGGVPGPFAQGDGVTFDDTGSNSPAINLTTALSPGSVTVNASQNYLFAGTGQLTGTMGLVKSGAGTLTLSNANSFTGGCAITGGTLQMNNIGAAGAGTIADGGTLLLSAGTGLTYTNVITGAGHLSMLAGSGGTAAYVQIGTSLAGFTGAVDIGCAGAARFVNRTANGSLGAGITVNLTTNGQLYLQSGTCAARLNVAGFGDGEISGGVPFGAIRMAAPISGPVTLTGDGVTITGGSTNYGPIGDSGLGYGINLLANTLTLCGTNTYGGATVISGGDLVLAASGSLADSRLISLAGGTTFDVSGQSGFALQAGQTLAGTGGTGTLNGSVNVAAGTLALTYTNGTPALTVTNGTLTLSNNAVSVTTGTALPAGSYLLVTKGTGGAVAGTVASSRVTVQGAGLAAGCGGSLLLLNSQLYLTVQTLVAPVLNVPGLGQAGQFGFGFSGPGGQSFRVLAATNLLLPLTNWLVLTNGTFGGGLIGFTDTPSIAGQKFYRITSP